MNKKLIISAIIAVPLVAGLSYFINSGSAKHEFIELKTDTALANVYFVQDPEATQFHGQIIIHRGEADMSGPEGIAHYIEHLVAWNALPDRDTVWQRDFNASTTETFTNYFMDSKDQDQVMTYLSNVFAPIELDETYMKEEANIVKNEFELRVSEDKFFPYFTKLRSEIYEGTGLTRSVIGKPQDIVDFDPQAAIALFEENYKPEYADLILTGNMSKSDAQKLVNTYFGDLKSETVSDRILSTQSFQPLEDKQETTKDANLPVNLTLSGWFFKSDETLVRRNAIENLVSNIIDSDQPHMFSRKLVHEDKSFQDVSVGFTSHPENLGNEFELFGEIREGQTPEFLSESFKVWFESIKSNPERLQPVIEGYVKNERNAFEKVNPSEIYSYLGYDLRNYHQKPIPYADYIEELEKLTSKDVIAYLDNILANSNATNHSYLK